MRTIALLTISNIFMTFAWYGHLKYRSSPLWIAIVVSWSIALLEYCFMVPANRIGSYQFSTAQLKTIQEVVLFGTARGVLAAAVRLGIAGSYEAQQLQAGCGPWLDDLLRRATTLDLDDLAQTAPIADLLQARHDHLYSRLFQS